MNESLHEMIDRFLKERRQSERGGWAQVVPADLEQLAEIIHSLIDLKCEMDADGDVPIRFRLINRLETRNLIYDPVPYFGIPGHYDGYKLAEQVINRNLRIAVDDWSCFDDHRRLDETMRGAHTDGPQGSAIQIRGV